ncbi:cadherin domain-containing protein [Flavobacteriaceae bacterium M23B6Z8]
MKQRFPLRTYIMCFTLTVLIFSCGKDDDVDPVQSQNSAPEIKAQSFNASEAIDDATIIGKVTATDSDNDVLIFSINTNSDELFDITDDGDLSLASGRTLDFETATQHILSVNVTDGEATADATITINVVDVDENSAPVFNDQVFSVQENVTGQGGLIGTLSATDPDADTVTFQWVAPDPDDSSVLYVTDNAGNTTGFVLNSTTGEIRTANDSTGNLDFEMISQYVVSVFASDSELSTQADITINVTDENDRPLIDSQTFTVAEDIDETVLIGQIVASDQDNDPLTFSVDIDYDLLFDVSSTGEVRLRSGSTLDFETKTSHQLDIFVSDGTETTGATITIDVTDVAESGGTVSRFAGNVNGIAGNIDGDALTQSALSSPSSIVRDSQGIIYILNSGFVNVKRIDANNQVSTLNFNLPTSVRRFIPAGLAVDTNDRLYISDSGSHVIYRWDPTTEVLTTFAGTINSPGFSNGSSGTFNEPAGMDFDASGNLLVADVNNHSIRQVSSNGTVSTLVGSGMSGNGNGRFNRPVDVVISRSDGALYVADSGNHSIRVIRFSNFGGVQAIAMSTFAGDNSGASGFVDDNGLTARFNDPRALVIDSNDNLYVADTGNNTIRKITPNADVTTLNSSNQAGATNGDLNVARFDAPSGIELDASGNLYIGDSDNNVIRYIQFQ